MSNKFTYSTYTFDDSVIVSAEIATEQSLLSEHLSADTLSLFVRCSDTGDQKLYTVFMEWYHTVNDEGYVIRTGNLADYTYGTPIFYYRDNVLYGKFYVTQITRVGDELFQITAVSAIGMMAYMTHKGGVYTAARAGTIINDIMSGTEFTYSVQSAVANTVVSGMLPYGDKMSNLQQVLFAIGASLIKDSSGNLSFVFNLPTTTKSIENEVIREGTGDNVFLAPATRISLTEHLYYQNPNTQSEEIYRASSTVTGATIILDEPVVASSITGDSGITFTERTSTCITFSGIGSIYAIKYTHITSEISWNAATVNGEENEITVGNMTLVTALNSANVMERLVKYYTQRKQTNLGFYVSTEKTGDYVSFDDRFGDEKDGFVSKLTINLGKEMGGEAEVITNWYPTDTGNNFNAYQLIQSAGTITVPTAARGKEGRLVLIGGFRGGQGGSAGEDGTDCVKGEVLPQQGTRWTGGEGGKEGGKGGQGGVGCMVYSVDIASLPASFTVNEIGAGGAGGAAGAFQMEGSMGVLGGNTRVTINGTTYSSASGTENTTGFINFIDGTFYNYRGNDGFDNNTGYGGDGNYSSSSSSNKVGGSFTANGTTWSGGSGGRNASSGNSSYWGGAGGGAAYGANGNNGGNGSSSYYGYSGDGGSGATPMTPTQASFPYGGNGGHGGGCGGGAGGGWTYYGMSDLIPGSGGAGGSGSPGGQGSNGAVIFYYGTT